MASGGTHRWESNGGLFVDAAGTPIEICARCKCERRARKPGEALDEPGGGHATWLYRRVGKRWTPNRPTCLGGGDPRSSGLRS